MQFHKTSDIAFCSKEKADLDYIRETAEKVYSLYPGTGHRWQLSTSDEVWPISFGGRAGVLGIKINDRIACVKLFYDERLRTRLRTALGYSKARRAYQNGIRLSTLGIACPKMLGYAERRPTGPALIVTELANGYVRLDLWAIEHGVPRPIVQALAHFIRNLHNRGIWHTDLSPRNILMDPSDPKGRFVLLDYEDARFANSVSNRRRLDNLHHLHERIIGYVPLRDQLRFLQTYTNREDYSSFRNSLRNAIIESDFKWLRTHLGPNTTSIPLQGTR